MSAEVTVTEHPGGGFGLTATMHSPKIGDGLVTLWWSSPLGSERTRWSGDPAGAYTFTTVEAALDAFAPLAAAGRYRIAPAQLDLFGVADKARLDVHGAAGELLEPLAALSTAPRTVCDQCNRVVGSYHRDEAGRAPVGGGYGPYRAVPHTGRRGGCYAGTKVCVVSDRETSHLAELARSGRQEWHASERQPCSTSHSSTSWSMY